MYLLAAEGELKKKSFENIISWAIRGKYVCMTVSKHNTFVRLLYPHRGGGSDKQFRL